MKIAEEFGTPIYTFNNPNAALDHQPWREAIYQQRARDPGRTVSNRMGWQGALSLFSVPALAGLERLMFACAEQVAHHEQWRMDQHSLVIQAWANINGKGGSNLLHSHANCFLSGCYYIDTPAGCGNFIYRDPRSQAYAYQPPYADAKRASEMRSITPVPGMLLLFPAWLLHGVLTNSGDSDRVSVAFNVGLAQRPAAQTVV